MIRGAWIGCAALLAACSASAGSGSEYREVPLTDERFATPQAVFAPILQGFPEGSEGRQELELSVRKAANGRYVVVVTRTGLLDDSVEGSQQRAVLTPEGGGWRLIELGERWRCYRGRVPADWVTVPCH